MHALASAGKCRCVGVLLMAGVVWLAAGTLRAATSEVDVLLQLPRPEGHYVRDYAGVFSAEQRQTLETFLTDVEAKTTAEIAVITLPSLEGGDINDLANQMFARLGIGKKGKDNGLLILTAIKDRRIRMEVGYGLEGFLPDARIGRMLDETVLPHFREGRYAAGLIQGAQAAAEVIAQNAGVTLTPPAGTPPVPPAAPEEKTEFTPAVFMVLLAIFAPIILLIVFGVRKGWIKTGGSGGGFSSGGGGGGSGGGFGGGSSGGGGASRGW